MIAGVRGRPRGLGDKENWREYLYFHHWFNIQVGSDQSAEYSIKSLPLKLLGQMIDVRLITSISLWTYGECIVIQRKVRTLYDAS